MDSRRNVIVVSFAACALAAPAAWSDVFTWVDQAGNVTVSNVPPPEGVRVTKRVKPTAAEKAATERARDASRDAEVQALTNRVRELEQQVHASVNGPPPDIVYPPILSSPVRFGTTQPPAIVSYATDVPMQPAASDCPPGWINCWGLGNVPTSVVVIDAGNGRHGHAHHAGRSSPGSRRPTSPQQATAATPIAPMRSARAR